MLRVSNATGHSAVVELQLEVAGNSYPLGQVSADFIIADGPMSLPPCEGFVIVTVDGQEHRARVRLESGMSPQVTRTPVRRLD